MSITAGTVAVGEAIWKAIRPWRRLKIARNKRRARLGKPLLPIEPEDYTMLPKGSATYTGIGVSVAGIPVGFLVAPLTNYVESLIVSANLAPATCAPEIDTCVPAATMALGLVMGAFTALGGAISTWGRKRAAKREAEAAAAAADIAGLKVAANKTAAQ